MNELKILIYRNILNPVCKFFGWILILIAMLIGIVEFIKPIYFVYLMYKIMGFWGIFGGILLNPIFIICITNYSISNINNDKPPILNINILNILGWISYILVISLAIYEIIKFGTPVLLILYILSGIALLFIYLGNKLQDLFEGDILQEKNNSNSKTINELQQKSINSQIKQDSKLSFQKKDAKFDYKMPFFLLLVLFVLSLFSIQEQFKKIQSLQSEIIYLTDIKSSQGNSINNLTQQNNDLTKLNKELIEQNYRLAKELKKFYDYFGISY